MSGQYHPTQFPPQYVPPPCAPPQYVPPPCAPPPCAPPPCAPPPCVESIFRSSGGGAARKRRCRPVPRQHHTAASRRTEIPEREHRTSVRLTHFSPAQLGGRLHPRPVSHQGVEQGRTPVGGSTTPPRQCSREAAWWDGPGPALSRGAIRSVVSTFTSSGWCSLNALPSPPLMLPRRRICRTDNAVFPAPP